MGYRGEKLVCDYLIKNGYTIIKTNYTIRGGEIDIIAQSGEIIAFIEVKTRKINSMVTGAEAVSKAKQKRIILTAQSFLLKENYDLQPRFDVAEVIVKNNIASINYFENAFDSFI